MNKIVGVLVLMSLLMQPVCGQGISSNLTAVWVYETAAGISVPPVVENGRVFVGSGDTNVYCLNAADGRLIWKFASSGPIESDIVLDGGILYTATTSQVLALDSSDGELVWSYLLDSEMHTSPMIRGNVLYIASEMVLYALDKKTGRLQWKFDAPTTPQFLSPPLCVTCAPPVPTKFTSPSPQTYRIASMTMADGGPILFMTPYILDSAPRGSAATYWLIYYLDANSHAPRWQTDITENKTGLIYPSAAVDGGLIYLYSQSRGEVYVLRLSDGSKVTGANRMVWGNRMDTKIGPGFPLIDSSRLYVPFWGGKIYALDKVDGSTLWKFTSDGGGFIGFPPAIADGKLVFGTDVGEVYVLDAGSGTRLGRYKVNASFLSSPAVAEGKVFLTSDTGRVYAFAQPTITSYSIASTPQNASIYLDGALVGKTPATVRTAIGLHMLKLEKAGYYGLTEEVDVKDGGAFSALLREIPVSKRVSPNLSVSSDPVNATVFIDDSPAAKTPCTVNVTAGVHNVVLRLAGYRQWEKSIVIVEGENRMDASLFPLSGTLVISSDPGGSDVFINGQKVGKTPLRISEDGGFYDIRIVRSGYAEWSTEVFLQQTQTLEVNAKLASEGGSNAAIDLVVISVVVLLILVVIVFALGKMKS
jgi:outer membrane protein assembly factor BamB